ncbi:N-acetylmuramoyl-L-alanine amidase [Streptomyces sioyaensis]|uniref:N-acetylmuramoyl-L-alanine amidase n=1 Tax=Streptomyces sioyaensis TaxID=67364 RepID=UPI0037A4112F
MPRMPGATWRPVINVHKNGTKEHRGLVLHVQAGDNSPFGWFDRTDSQASSDFWVSKTGTIEQYVDTGVDYAWAQAAGNPYYASVETEGEPSEALTAAQVEGVAKIYAWGHKTFGWPLVVVDSTIAHGLTWHGAGGAAWGGHTGCPGDLRKKQRADIMARAKVLVGDKPARKVSLAHIIAAARRDPSAPQGHTTYKDEVLLVERALADEGLLSKAYVDGSFGTRTVSAYGALQRRYGYSGTDANGIPGLTSLTRLGKAHGFTVTP